MRPVWHKRFIFGALQTAHEIVFDPDSMQDNVSYSLIIPIPPILSVTFRQSNNNDGEYDAGDDISDDNGENDENASLCECYNTWRRASNDRDDDDELLDNTDTSTKKHKHFDNSGHNSNGTDSGCDSDCPENISELCKKFEENLSEQDVSSNEFQPNKESFMSLASSSQTSSQQTTDQIHYQN